MNYHANLKNSLQFTIIKLTADMLEMLGQDVRKETTVINSELILREQ